MTTVSEPNEVCVRCGKSTDKLVSLLEQNEREYIYVCDNCFNPQTDRLPDEGSCYGSEYWY